MTGSPPSGNSRADAMPVSEPAEESVPAPGHGAVGVFQAPQPVQPHGAAVDDTLDIDSPFLDLFGGVAGPVSGTPLNDPYASGSASD